MASTGSMPTEEQGMTPTAKLKSALLRAIKRIEKIEANLALEPTQTEKLEVEKLKEDLHQMVSLLEQCIQEFEETKWILEAGTELAQEQMAKKAPRLFNLVEEIEQKYALIPPQTLEEVQELVEMRAMEHELEEQMRRLAQVNIRKPALLLKMEEELETTRDVLGMIRDMLGTIRFKEELLELKGEQDELLDGGNPVKNKEDEE